MTTSSQSSFEPAEPTQPAYIRIRLTHIDTTHTSVKELPQEFAADKRKAETDDRYIGIPYVFKTSPIFGRDVPIDRVPVIRIFGATELGQRCCLHVHGTAPYVYVQYKGDPNPDIVNDYILRFGRALNYVLGNSFKQPKRGRKAQFVGYIALVKGIPFYGFHVGYRYFLKIMLLAPQFKARTCAELRSGKIMDTAFEIFEAHINFAQQFMTDYNLYGCGYVDLEHVKFRDALPTEGALDLKLQSSGSGNSISSPAKYAEETVPARMRYPPGRSPTRISPHSSLELDVHVSAILNRKRLAPRLLHHDFTEYLHNPYSPDQKLVFSVRELWTEEAKRRAETAGDPPPKLEVEEAERRYGPGESPHWAQLDTFRQQLVRLAEHDRNKYHAQHGGREPTFETFGPPQDQGALSMIPTAYESTECTFPSTWERQEREGNPYGIWAVRGIGIDPASHLAPSAMRDPRLDLVEGRTISPQSATASTEMSDMEEEEDFYLEGSDDDAAEERARNLRAGYDMSEEEDGSQVDPLESRTVPAGPQNRSEAHSEDEQASLPMSSQEQVNGDEDTMLDDVPPTEPIEPHSDSLHDIKVNAGGSLTDLVLSDYRPSSPAVAQVTGNNSVQSVFSAPKLSKMSPSKANVFGVHAARAARVPPGHTHGHASVLARRSKQDQEIGWLRKGETTLERMMKRGKPSSTLAAPVAAVVHHANGEASVLVKGQEANLQVSDDEDSSGDTKVQFAIPPLQQERSRDYDSLYGNDPDDDLTEGEYSPTQKVLSDLDATENEQDEAEPPAKIRRVEINEPSQRPAILPQSSITSLMTTSDGATSTTVTPEIPSVPRLGKVLDDQSRFKDSSSSAVISGGTAGDTSSSTVQSYHGTRFQYKHLPPPLHEILATIEETYPHRQKLWTDPFYSRPSDVPKRTWEYASRAYRIPGSALRWIGEFARETTSRSIGPHSRLRPGSAPRWEYGVPPPSRKSLVSWLAAQKLPADTDQGENCLQQPMLEVTDFPLFSQMEGPTQPDQFKFTQMKQGTDAIEREAQHMAILSMELQARSRISKLGTPLVPDPAKDPIDAIFYCLLRESDGPLVTGYLAVRDAIMPDLAAIRNKMALPRLGVKCDTVYLADSELDLLNEFHDRFHDWDPEVLCGYEVQYASWGYLLERAEFYDLQLVKELGRTTEQSTGRHQGKEDQWSYTKTSSIKLTGRHCLPIWRILKSDVNLTQYSFENVAFHVLRERVPHYTPRTLTTWMASRQPTLVARTFEYWLKRVVMDVRMLDEAEVVTRNAEFARIYGVDFDSVLQRGSQYKVESFMFRIAKPESFVLLSPNRVEVGKQNAAECIPLIMEPQSAFYTSPVLVLDFQSLYPSCMIAYNMCYSTCLGRTTQFRGVWKLGVTKLEHVDGTLTLMREHVNITPNGIIFLKPHIRRSLLAKMLSEILDTRVMIKSSMKRYTDKALLKMLNARQLGLKFIANVTYGYTSATFSGRMPCVEIADAIVQTGRETLEKAMALINKHAAWGAKCVYGDTDSLFVELKGKTRDEAHRIGKEIADSITRLNPAPVKLKFEKVYLPCILAAKKRYVGFKYETLKDIEPDFDAKGIETVRRDGFPAQQKILEASLKILFRTKDISEVKAYVTRQFQRLQLGLVSPQDYIFAKEVKMGTYSDRVLPPPGVALAGARTALDPRAEPNYGERFPYVLTEGTGRTQVERAMTIEDFMKSSTNRLWADHYIQMMTKALARMFNLAGVNVDTWRMDVRSIKTLGRAPLVADSSQLFEIDPKARDMLTSYYKSDRCRSCRREIRQGPKAGQVICEDCAKQQDETSFALIHAHQMAAQKQLDIHRICATCCASTTFRPIEDQACESTDCPMFYSRKRADWEVASRYGNDKVVRKTFTRAIDHERE